MAWDSLLILLQVVNRIVACFLSKPLTHRLAASWSQRACYSLINLTKFLATRWQASKHYNLRKVCSIFGFVGLLIFFYNMALIRSRLFSIIIQLGYAVICLFDNRGDQINNLWATIFRRLIKSLIFNKPITISRKNKTYPLVLRLSKVAAVRYSRITSYY